MIIAILTIAVIVLAVLLTMSKWENNKLNAYFVMCQHLQQDWKHQTELYKCRFLVCDKALRNYGITDGDLADADWPGERLESWGYRHDSGLMLWTKAGYDSRGIKTT